MGYSTGAELLLGHVLWISFMLGLILFVLWAIKHMKKDDLFHLAITLLILGLAGAVLLGPSSFKGKRWHNYKTGFDKAGFYECLQDEACLENLKAAKGIE